MSDKVWPSSPEPLRPQLLCTLWRAVRTHQPSIHKHSLNPTHPWERSSRKTPFWRIPYIRSRARQRPCSQTPEMAAAGAMMSQQQPGSPAGAAAATARAASPAARRRQAALWGALVGGTLVGAACICLFVMPRPPPGAGGLRWQPRAQSGISLADAVRILKLAAPFSACLLAFQELGLRPLLGRAGAKQTTEATFFTSSIVVRLVFLATLVRHFHLEKASRGGGGSGAADAAHVIPTVALFVAAYSTDLVQMVRRGKEFSASYPKMVVPHHWLSLAWFGAWLALAAPAGADGVPVFNMVGATSLPSAAARRAAAAGVSTSTRRWLFAGSRQRRSGQQLPALGSSPFKPNPKPADRCNPGRPSST